MNALVGLGKFLGAVVQSLKVRQVLCRGARRPRETSFSIKSPLQEDGGGLGFALFLTLRGSDGGGGYCGRRMIETLILWQLEFE